MKQTFRCHCGFTAKFFVHQSTIPQLLVTGDFETRPAGRSVMVCGNHLAQAVTELGSLPYRTRESVKVRLVKS